MTTRMEWNDSVSLKRLGDLAPLQPGYHRALRALKVRTHAPLPLVTNSPRVCMTTGMTHDTHDRHLQEVLSRERQGKLRVAEYLSKESHGQLLASLFASSSPAAVAAADLGVGGVGEREEEEEEEI